MTTQSHFENIYLCVERHYDRGIVAAFTTEAAAEEYCSVHTYEGKPLYEVWTKGLNDYCPKFDDEDD